MEGPHPFERWDIRYLFHLTHRTNVLGIARDGLLSHRTAHERNLPLDISNREVNEKRGKTLDKVHDRPLHDYVPLYFRARNPMLSALRGLRDDIVVLYVDRDVIDRPGVVFTDGNAVSAATRFFSEVVDLAQLDWACLRAYDWTAFEDGRRKRCAEVLVPDRVAPESIRRVVASTDGTRDWLVAEGCRWEIRVRPDWYF